LLDGGNVSGIVPEQFPVCENDRVAGVSGGDVSMMPEKLDTVNLSFRIDGFFIVVVLSILQFSVVETLFVARSSISRSLSLSTFISRDSRASSEESGM